MLENEQGKINGSNRNDSGSLWIALRLFMGFIYSGVSKMKAEYLKNGELRDECEKLEKRITRLESQLDRLVRISEMHARNTGGLIEKHKELGKKINSLLD